MSDAHVSAEPEFEDDENTLCSVATIDKAQEFLDKHGPEIHPIFGVAELVPQSQNAEALTRKFSPATQQQIEQFLEMMDSNKDSSTYGTAVIDLRAQHSWEDTIKAAEDAHKKYEKASAVRRLSHGALPYAEMMQPFIRLIPNDSWGSVLCGGLRLVFEAFTYLDERRSRVLRSLLRIPDVVMLAETCLENYPSDKLLYRRVERVFGAALPAIEATTRWLKQRPVAKQFRAIILGPAYNKSFKDKLQSLEEALNELQERATVLRDQSIRDTQETVHMVQDIVNHNGTQISNVAEDVKHISKLQNETQAKVEELRELQQAREDAREALKEVIDQKIKNAAWRQENHRILRRLQEQVKVLEEIQVSLTESDLVDILDISMDLANQDFRTMQRACGAAEMSHIEISGSIFNGHRMTQWLQSKDSGALFIEGRAPCSFGRNTPLSLLCVDAIERLQDNEPAVPIHFFCGSHTSSRDPVRGPTGIVRSLIAQVLQLFSPELNFLSRRYRHQLEILHLHTLCDCFRKLVRRLPITTVLFCIIDGISFFETKEWASGCKQIMDCLHELLDDSDKYPVFKLLVTSPVRSRYVVDTFPDDCRLIVAADDTNDARHGPTEREMAMSNRRHMRSVAEKRAVHSRRRNLIKNRAGLAMTGTDTESAWDEKDHFSEMDLDHDGTNTSASRQ